MESTSTLISIPQITGPITESYLRIVRRYHENANFPPDDAPKNDKVAFDMYRVMDGLQSITPGYVVGRYAKTIEARNLVFQKKEEQPFGLKIHVAIDWDNPLSVKVLENVGLICRQQNLNSMETTFKVVYPQTQQRLKEMNDPQYIKFITIYPEYSHDGRSNVVETQRLCNELKGQMKKIGSEGSKNSASILGNSEFSVGYGLFIRAGAFNEAGEQLLKEYRTMAFNDQLLSLDSTSGGATNFVESFNRYFKK